MKKKPYPITLLTGGLVKNPDPLYITDNQSPNVTNIRYHKGIVKRDFTPTSLGNTNSERVMKICKYPLRSGVDNVIVLTEDAAYNYANSTFEAITGATFTGSSVDHFWYTVYDDVFICTNGYDPAKKWNGTTWANLGGLTDIKFKYNETFYNYHVICNIVDSSTPYPQRVKWSNIGNAEAYHYSKFFDLADTPGHITGTIVYNDRLFVFKPDSIYEIYFIGGSDDFKARRVITGVGCRAGQTIKATSIGVIFLGTDGVYVFDGAAVRNISKPLFNYLFETGGREINIEAISKAHAAYNYDPNEYLICLPSAGSDEADVLLKYDVDNNTWTRVSTGYTAMEAVTLPPSPVSWQNTTGVWSDWYGSWVEYVGTNTIPVMLYGTKNGVVKKDDRTYLSTDPLVYETKDFVFEHSQRWVECKFLCKGDSFSVRYSTDKGLTWSDPKTLTPDSTQFTLITDYLNLTSSFLRIRITSTNQNFELMWVEPWYIERKMYQSFNPGEGRVF